MYQFSLLETILKVNILRKVLDYSFVETDKVYVPQVKCVKDKI